MLAILVSIAVAVVTLAVTIKRAHDLGRSGFYLLLMCVPVYGIWIALRLMFVRGSHGSNDYGEDKLPNSGYDAYA